VARSADGVTAAIQTLFRLNGSRRIHQQQSAAAGITVSSLALRVLERVVESGSTTPGQLATLLELDPATVTRLLRQLEDAGLVSRARSEDDGRVSTIAATPEGTAAFARYREVIWDQVERAMSGWAPEDAARLAELLTRLVHDILEVPYQPPGPSAAGGGGTRRPAGEALRTP
jgi:DNA-binding MarR family transcriptional regulator